MAECVPGCNWGLWLRRNGGSSCSTSHFKVLDTVNFLAGKQTWVRLLDIVICLVKVSIRIHGTEYRLGKPTAANLHPAFFMTSEDNSRVIIPIHKRSLQNSIFVYPLPSFSCDSEDDTRCQHPTVPYRKDIYDSNHDA